MQIELLKAWHGWKPEHRFTAMPRGQARLLVRLGIAKEVHNENTNAAVGIEGKPKRRTRKPSGRKKTP